MKILITNNLTGITTEVEIEENASQEYIDLLKQPTQEVQPIEDRIVKIEQEQEVIISVLTDIMGV